MSEPRSHPWCIFGNLVNELMVQVPDERHARALVAVSPRKIWLAQPGDLLVLPIEPPPAFWAYAHDLLGMPLGVVDVLVAESTSLQPLAHWIRQLGQVRQLQEKLRARSGVTALPFALDRPTVDLFVDLGVGIDGYDGMPPESAVRAAYELNTKSGFHELAGALGVPRVPSVTCGDEKTLRSAVATLLGSGRGAVVKLNRASNGFGLLFLTPDQRPRLDELLDAHIGGFSDQPRHWVVEELMAVDTVLTVEMWSADSGPVLVHTGQMNTPNGSFSGQLTPPPEHSRHHEELAGHGLAWGRHLHATGYRGPFDLDAITAGGQLYVTETNVRRTGTTYLEYLVQRLVPDAAQVTWLADSKVGARTLDFDQAVGALRGAGIAFDDGVGVVLTADTRQVDRKWRYLIIGHDLAEIRSLEKRAADVLGLG